MLKGIRRIALMMTMCVGVASANSHPAPGQFELTGEFLWSLATFDDTSFVIDGPAVGGRPTGTVFNGDPDFKPGARATAKFGICGGKELELDYTWLQLDTQRTVTSATLWAIRGTADFDSAFEAYSGSAASALDFLYQRGDFFYNQRIYNCGGLDFYFKAGIEGDYIRLHEDFEYAITGGALGLVRQRHEVWGVGPELGFNADYSLFGDLGFVPGGLSLVVTSTGSLLVGQSQASLFNSVTATGVTTVFADLTERNTTRVFPAFHQRVGLHYDLSLDSFGVGIEIGYEFNTYLRALARMNEVDDVAEGLLVHDFRNYDIQGLYVNASVRF